MKKVLVTGFETFGGEAVNPSWEAVKLLDDRYIKLRLPVEYARAGEELIQRVSEEKPDIMVCVGQAGGRRGISVECAALNRDHAAAPDNAGEIRLNTPIAQGENAYFTNVDAPAIAEAMNGIGVEAHVSYFAGTYVCNHIYYTLLRNISENGGALGLFLHVPYSDEQKKDAPCMSISDMARGIEKAIAFMASEA